MEEWDSKGVYVNYWETDCNFIQIPWTQKKWWQMRLLDVVEEWAGVREFPIIIFNAQYHFVLLNRPSF
jgi:hypothetical protein